MNKPTVAVSACLLGQAVRYDGKHKYTSLIADELEKYCRLIPVCPEVEIGLGVPRDKIQLTKIGSTIRVLKTTDCNCDVTDLLVGFATQFIKKHHLSGLVLQDRSPSCGIGNTKLYSEAGLQIGVDSGLFASTILSLVPDLPVIQASQLQRKVDVEVFVGRVITS